MSSSGYMLRRDQRLADRGEEPCPGCGHPLREHREKGYSHAFDVVRGELVEVKHPDHKAGRFFCYVQGCDCIREEEA